MGMSFPEASNKSVTVSFFSFTTFLRRGHRTRQPQADLKHPSDSASDVLGLKVCVSTTGCASECTDEKQRGGREIKGKTVTAQVQICQM